MLKKQINNITWISCAKLIAMIAVILDHMHGLLFQNPTIDNWSFFSVTSFVFLSGITAYQSNIRHLNEPVAQYTLKRLLKLFIPYITVTTFTVLITGKFFNFKSVLNEILSFKTFGPAYYVLMALQLIAISPILARIIRKLGTYRLHLLFHALFFIIIVYFSYLCTKYTFITDTYGAGQFVFGGTFLAIYALGMLFAYYELQFTRAAAASVCAVAALALHIGMFLAMQWTIRVHGDLYVNSSLRNPPSLPYILYSFVTIAFLMSFFSFLELTHIAWIQKILQILAYIGNRTLSIFLYHMFLMLYIFPLIPVMNLTPTVKIVTYLLGMILVPVIWQDLLAHMKKWIFTV